MTLLKGPAHTVVVVGGFVMGLAMGALDVGEVVTGALVVGEVEIGAALCTNAKMMLAMIDKVQSVQSKEAM